MIMSLSTEDSTRLTHNAFRQGYVNFLVCAIGGGACWIVVSGILSLVLGQEFGVASWYAFVALSVGPVIALIGSRIRSIRNRGPMLRDCGPFPLWWQYAVFASVLIFLLLLSVFKSSNTSYFYIGIMIPVSVAMALGRLQVCESGLNVYGDLLRWEDIRSYRWADDNTILISTQTWLPFVKRAIPIPPRDKAAVIKYLAKKRVSTR